MYYSYINHQHGVHVTDNDMEEEEFMDLISAVKNAELLESLNTRKDEYKTAELQANKSGDSQMAVSYRKTVKQFEEVITAILNERPVDIDISKLPGPPSQQQVPPVEKNEAPTGNTSPEVASEAMEVLSKPTLVTASSIAEALQQHLEFYEKQEAKAEVEENASKARRMGRIVKQFENAIKCNNAGTFVPLEDLPTPLGYAPIIPPISRHPEPRKCNLSRSQIDIQVALLMERQKAFQMASQAAKQEEEVIELLRTANGFNKLLDDALYDSIDISSLPLPPANKSELEDCDLAIREEGSESDILSRLEEQLTKQLKLSLSTRDYNKAIGDVGNMNRFEKLASSVTRDLVMIQLAKKTAKAQVPKFHYETKDFSIIKSCTDLNDNDLELTIIRGVNYNSNNPKDVDTYVKFEFPYPEEEPVRNKTPIVKNTNNPEYNKTFILPIQRTAIQCQQVFERHGIKFEIYSKRGFFRNDALLGIVFVKLQPLQTQCELHESFDLVEGPNKVGGKLEIRLRVRNPINIRQVQQHTEKWLVLDH